MKYIRYLLGILVLFGSYHFALAQPSVPSGRAIKLDEILSLSNTLANYLYTIAIIIAGIALVWAGIVYMTAGGDSTKVNKAKGILVGALIGTFIVFASGAIISTIANFTTNPGGFFGGGSTQAYGCSCVNGFLNCVPQVGGAYSDPACYGSCQGTVSC